MLVATVVTLMATMGNVILLGQASQELNAAVATANQVLGILYDISVLFSLGALVVITQLLGAGHTSSARRASSIVLRASALLGTVIAVGVAPASPLVLRIINTPASILDDAQTYLWIVAGGLILNAYIVAATAVLRAYGRTALILVLGLVVNVLDLATLAVCLYVLDLGVVGAALPTLLVRGVGVVLLVWLVRRSSGATLFGPLAAKDASDETGAKVMARLSIPSVIENGTYNLAIVFMVSLMNLLGPDAINARSYALTLTALVTGVILALAQANETIVGWDIGENRRAHARSQTVRTTIITVVAAGVLAAVLWFFGQPALSVFGASSEVIEGARAGLLVSVILLPLSAVTAVVYGALRSAGDVFMPMVVSTHTENADGPADAVTV